MSHSHTKTPGGSGASEKFMKQQAQSTHLFPLYPTGIFFFFFFFFLHLLFVAVANFSSAHGTGAPNAAGHTELKRPGEAPVASDSGSTNVGIDNGTNQPGEKGISGVPVDSKPGSGNANMK